MKNLSWKVVQCCLSIQTELKHLVNSVLCTAVSTIKALVKTGKHALADLPCSLLVDTLRMFMFLIVQDIAGNCTNGEYN